jgi:hypothetical protein
VKCARDDVCEQRRLDEHQQRRRDAERDVDKEQNTNRPRAADEARIERAHR